MEWSIWLGKVIGVFFWWQIITRWFFSICGSFCHKPTTLRRRSVLHNWLNKPIYRTKIRHISLSYRGRYCFDEFLRAYNKVQITSCKKKEFLRISVFFNQSVAKNKYFFPFSKACHGDTSLQNLMAKFAGGKYSEKEMHRILNTEDSASGNVFTSKTEMSSHCFLNQTKMRKVRRGSPNICYSQPECHVYSRFWHKNALFSRYNWKVLLLNYRLKSLFSVCQCRTLCLECRKSHGKIKEMVGDMICSLWSFSRFLEAVEAQDCMPVMVCLEN